MPEADIAIHVKGVSHWFGPDDAKKQVLCDINLALPRGKMVMIKGPSGSGKTTLLTLIGCLRRVEQGSINLLGQELAGSDEQILVRMRRRLGFIFQLHNLHSGLSAIENVRLGLDVHNYDFGLVKNMPDRRNICAHTLELLGLNDKLDAMPDHLSGGQKQRVAIARALVGSPEVIFADEPTAALDIETGLNAVNLMKDMGSTYGTTTLLVTHDPRLQQLADMVVELEDGHIANIS